MDSSSRNKNLKEKTKYLRGKVTKSIDNAATNGTDKVVNKLASVQNLNVSLKSTYDSTPPVTVPPATDPDWNFITNSELFLITMIGHCPACIRRVSTLNI